MEGVLPRRSSPPPTYEEAIFDRPPRYDENPHGPSRIQQLQIGFGSARQSSRISPTATNQVDAILNQPSRQIEGPISQQRQKRLGFNCLCSACKWTPCSCGCELFCFNCLGFLAYLLFCAPGVYVCWGCGKISPETCGDCPLRDSKLMESFEEPNNNLATRCCWFCVGPCCCFTCDADKDVCPFSETCVNRFGVRSVLKKMTCFCLSYKFCDFTANIMDEGAVGFICDCREVGCSC